VFLALLAAAVAPVPLISPERAIGYPSSALRNEEQGRVDYEVDVDITGIPTGCRIVASSGHASLDEETCRDVLKRVRFKPGTDEHGNPVAGVYRGNMVFKLAPGN
jgi:protein TonB